MGAAAVHPTDQTLQAYGQGKLGASTADSVNQHLESCPDCQRRVGELTSDSFLDRLQDVRDRSDSPVPVSSALAGLSRVTGGPTSGEPPPASSLPSELAGHPDYEVIRELGQGGMGTVYLALNRLMGRHEVLKVVSSHMINRRGVLDRFLGEIRNAARLHHANIVTAYSAMRIGDSIVFAMEYVEGLDLSRLVKTKGPLPIAHACNFVHQAALGLQHAHEKGMVHRDIKPSNLMLSRSGNRAAIKVLDFGLAKVKSEGDVDGGLTHEGQMLGSPEYVAPEQTIDARNADIRADIYSLGCTLYYLLTGGPPFRATSLYELLQAHHSMDALPLNVARPEVPVELAAIVATMMAKEPERRFQTPKEVAQALAPFFKPGQVTSKPSGPPPLPKGDQPPRVPPSRPAPAFETLVELSAIEPSVVPAKIAKAKRLPLWIWPPLAAGVLLLVAWAAGLFPHGTKDPIVALKDVPKKAAVPVDRDTKLTATAEVSPGTKAILTALEKPIPLSFGKETPLARVLKYVKQATKKDGTDTGIPIYVDPIGLEEAENSLTSTVTIELSGVPLAKALGLALEQVDLAYIVKDDVLIISSPRSIERVWKEASVIAEDTKKATMEVMARLDAPIPMEFANETPLEDVLKHVRHATNKGDADTGVPIYVNPAGLEEAEQTMTSTVAIDLVGVPLKTTLCLLLRQLDLAYVVKDGMVVISSTDSIKKELTKPATGRRKAVRKKGKATSRR
jgi:serine/threonine protein kinase